MNLTKEELNMMMRNMYDGIQFRERQREYEETTSIEQYCEDLKELGINYTEEAVVDKYKELEDFSDVLDYFYYNNEEKWGYVDSRRDLVFNSDSQYYYTSNIIEKNFDTKELLDPFFIENHIYDIDKYCPKNEIQKEVMHIITKVIAYGKKKNIVFVDDIFDDIDFHSFMKEAIKKCHNRDHKFKELMKSYYDTFKDADRSLYKIK